nr:mannonate dehydratase [Marinicella sp. W31]MDC2880174.1 mannonate dehydratase [Marinicella sp. W31]
MQQTWRWFGPADTVTVETMMQAGVEGVVSALHHVPTGAVWSPAEIELRQQQIAKMANGRLSGLAWSVVESLPVSEDIKKQKGAWRTHIENWKQSMRHLASAGIEVICYNFMPVLDWTRTDLAWERPNGARCMRFDLIDFAAYDIHILARPGAAESFPDDVREAAAARFAQMSEADKEAIAGNVVFGLPGAAERFSLDDVRTQLGEYDNISEEKLQGHMIDFLSEVAPLAEELGVRLCCHPDDPPFPLLGLPRIMSTEAQYSKILDAVDLPANGVTLCSGRWARARTTTPLRS